MEWAKFSEYGLLGIVLGTVFFILWRMIVWVMAFVKDQTAQHAEERKQWQVVFNGMKDSIQLHNQQSAESRAMQNQAHEYQRAEHEKLAGHLDEISKALGRINGYKDH